MIDHLITFAEAAKLIGPDVTASHLRKAYHDGKLQAMKIGRSYRTTPAALETWIMLGLTWRSSSSMGQTESTVPGPSHGWYDTSGTSPGTKDESAESVARADAIVNELLQRKNSQSLSSLGTTLIANGQVIPYPSRK